MSTLDLEALEKVTADIAMLPPTPWELWTSCSYRRIKRRDGSTTKSVLEPYNQRGDGHPDLSMPEDQLFALVRVMNATPALLRYAALGHACESHGLGWYIEDGTMRFQAPADVIEENARQAAEERAQRAEAERDALKEAHERIAAEKDDYFKQWGLASKAHQTSQARTMELEVGLRKFQCGSCAGTGQYKQRGRGIVGGWVLVTCKGCDGLGVDRRARDLLQQPVEGDKP